METSLYYTFSTISQTLAGAIGLLGAFLVYHLSEMQRSLNTYLEKLYFYYPSSQETVDLDFMWERGDVEGMLKYFRKDKLRYLEDGDCLAKPLFLVPAERLHKRRTRLVTKVKVALFWTCITIVFSLAVLAGVPQSPNLFGVDIVAYILIAGLFLASLCIYLYARIVLAIFQN